MIFKVLLGLASGVQSSYALLVGEICPNKYKWLGIMVVVVPNVIPTGFGAYLGEPSRQLHLAALTMFSTPTCGNRQLEMDILHPDDDHRVHFDSPAGLLQAPELSSTSRWTKRSRRA
jgi:hypothetical protein